MYRGDKSAHGRKEASGSHLGYSQRPEGVWFPNPLGPPSASVPVSLVLLENCSQHLLQVLLSEGVFLCVLLAASSKAESLSIQTAKQRSVSK